MPITRRHAALLAALTALAPLAAQAQTPGYPNKPVRIIVGFPAGTGPDIVARLLAQKLSEGWGNLGVIVDNKPGAAGLIAASEAARAAPDGYTLMLGETGQLAIAPSSYNKLPYDPAKDFVPVSQVVTADFILLVNPQKVPAKNVKEFVDWTRQQKGLFMATFGAGTPGHFGAYMFGDAIGIKPEPVHFKNTGDAMSGIFSGDVSGVFASAGLAAPNVKSGKLAALASTGAQRSAALPDVPTFKEQGYANLEFNSWFGIVAPGKTPPEIVAKLNADIVRAMRSPDGQKKMEDAGFRVTGTSAQEFSNIIAADTRTWGKAVAATGFKAD
ncbi:tripartite tricarboxylate transporter substrate binding protein [Pseudorhodoferax sp. Leaf267]|uniref:Bug family tripartite tricarboxylate transporter substrate binding protein n=1 Tax=Pseudorhodoferax sp. Leaf267 TaxID=1736316 RepID=UPI0006F7170C|nr:tripartite tricarboxylate transporter substrate binding protein [Pseudorhodoferax sp. Leaf267]KQP14046.1 MFS transporter [Pseudorhodoferax sp. Leaf267]